MWPYIIWVEPTLHSHHQNDRERITFIKALHTEVLDHDKCIVLPLKQPWKEEDTSLINWSRQIYTPKGMEKFYGAVDETLQFADTRMMRNHGLFLKNAFKKEKNKRGK